MTWVHGSGPSAAESTVSINMNDGLLATREGRTVCKWANDITPGADQTVLTDANLVYNLPEGKRFIIIQICMELTTASDTVEFELGFTDQINGAGTFTPVTPERILKTGSTSNGFDGITFYVVPPGVIRYSDGARSITFRVDCNDASATITPTFHGWIEDE